MSRELEILSKIIIIVTLFTATPALLVFALCFKLPRPYRISLALTLGLSFLSFLFGFQAAGGASTMYGSGGEQGLLMLIWLSRILFSICAASLIASLFLFVRGLWILLAKRRQPKWKGI